MARDSTDVQRSWSSLAIDQRDRDSIGYGAARCSVCRPGPPGSSRCRHREPHMISADGSGCRENELRPAKADTSRGVICVTGWRDHAGLTRPTHVLAEPSGSWPSVDLPARCASWSVRGLEAAIEPPSSSPRCRSPRSPQRCRQTSRGGAEVEPERRQRRDADVPRTCLARLSGEQVERDQDGPDPEHARDPVRVASRTVRPRRAPCRR